MSRPTVPRDLTAESFQKLLVWLDSADESTGERYLEMRRRLTSYFERKRCELPDSLADATLNRVARRLAEEGHIQGPPAQYCYIVAKFVFLEYLRDAAKWRDASARLASSLGAHSASGSETDASERLGTCLDACLDKLPGADRELIVEYYQGERRDRIDRRKRIADRLGATANAVMIRASRIRLRLEQCVNECCG